MKITKVDKRRLKKYNKKTIFGSWKYRIQDICREEGEKLKLGKPLSIPGLYYSLYKFEEYKPRKPKK